MKAGYEEQRISNTGIDRYSPQWHFVGVKVFVKIKIKNKYTTNNVVFNNISSKDVVYLSVSTVHAMLYINEDSFKPYVCVVF